MCKAPLCTKVQICAGLHRIQRTSRTSAPSMAGRRCRPWSRPSLKTLDTLGARQAATPVLRGPVQHLVETTAWWWASHCSTLQTRNPRLRALGDMSTDTEPHGPARLVPPEAKSMGNVVPTFLGRPSHYHRARATGRSHLDQVGERAVPPRDV